MINHPQLGDIEYTRVYFQYEVPEIFTCTFSNSDETYVGILVEDYVREEFGGTINVLNYYFVGANESEIKSMEKHKNMVRLFFSTRPVWYLNHQYTSNGFINSWRKETSIQPDYILSEDLTLC